MAPWPPLNVDYNTALKERKLKKIDLNVWKLHPEEDEHGVKKVFEVTGYPGLYKNESGELFDVRPKEGCPCKDTLMAKNEKELAGMLATALKNQLEALKNAEHTDKELVSELQKELQRAEKNHSLSQRGK